MSRWKSPERKRKLFDKQQGKCCYCDCKMEMPKSIGRHNSNDATWDHVVPRSRGGTNELSNLVLACRYCNESRGNGPQPRNYSHAW